MWDNHYYKEGHVLQKVLVITKWDRYYKLGQSLLQSGVSIISIIKWGNFIAKCGNYYRKCQYIFMTLGQMETHVYRQGQCGLRTEF